MLKLLQKSNCFLNDDRFKNLSFLYEVYYASYIVIHYNI